MGQRKFVGILDCISRNGYIEGWAKVDDDDFHVVWAGLLHKKKLIGSGLANQFRPDLLAAGVGHAWHAFRIRVDLDFRKLKFLPLVLIELPGGSPIAARSLTIPPQERKDIALSTDAMLSDTALEVANVQSLAGIEKWLGPFIEQNGVERFVELVYCYVLGRPADLAGLGQYSALITSGRLTPLRLIEVLMKSDERAAASWPILPPSDPNFPFRLEAR